MAILHCKDFDFCLEFYNYDVWLEYKFDFLNIKKFFNQEKFSSFDFTEDYEWNDLLWFYGDDEWWEDYFIKKLENLFKEWGKQVWGPLESPIEIWFSLDGSFDMREKSVENPNFQECIVGFEFSMAAYERNKYTDLIFETICTRKDLENFLEDLKKEYKVFCEKFWMKTSLNFKL